MLKKIDEIYATKGKKVLYANLKKDRPAQTDLMKMILGPTGNLRAPTLRNGRVLLVGFDEDTYKKILN